jgi:hypothetical protein
MDSYKGRLRFFEFLSGRLDGGESRISKRTGRGRGRGGRERGPSWGSTRKELLGEGIEQESTGEGVKPLVCALGKLAGKVLLLEEPGFMLGFSFVYLRATRGAPNMAVTGIIGFW